MENKIDIAMIEKMFPELQWIEDGGLRRKCGETLMDSFERGGWTPKMMEKLPVSVTRVQCSELNSGAGHVRAVVRIAASIYDILEGAYGKNTGLRDTVIAGALLHDLGKPMEFTLMEDGKPAYAPDAKIMRHPLSGAILAAEHGLDTELIHIIATHSFEGNGAYKTLAAKIVCAADNIAFDYLLAFNPEG